MNAHPGHLGDPIPDARRTTCGYGWCHDCTGCTAPATVHLSIAAPTHTAATASCDAHLATIRRSNRVVAEHKMTASCANPNFYWYSARGGRTWCGP